MAFNQVKTIYFASFAYAAVNRGAAITTTLVMLVLMLSIMLYMFLRRPVNKTWQGNAL